MRIGINFRFIGQTKGIHVNKTAAKQEQSANAIVDTMNAAIVKQYNPGLSDPQLKQRIAATLMMTAFAAM